MNLVDHTKLQNYLNFLNRQPTASLINTSDIQYIYETFQHILSSSNTLQNDRYYIMKCIDTIVVVAIRQLQQPTIHQWFPVWIEWYFQSDCSLMTSLHILMNISLTTTSTQHQQPDNARIQFEIIRYIWYTILIQQQQHSQASFAFQEYIYLLTYINKLAHLIDFNHYQWILIVQEIQKWIESITYRYFDNYHMDCKNTQQFSMINRIMDCYGEFQVQKQLKLQLISNYVHTDIVHFILQWYL